MATNSKVISIMLMFCVGLFALDYPIVGSGVTDFYSDAAVISEPSAGESFFGQDAHYPGLVPSYTDNGDGTITDNHTGLMWQVDMGEKISWHDAFTKADTMTLGGHDDWRFPTIKELYSLIIFTGQVQGQTAKEFFIDTTYFDQPLGDVSIGEREIDAQTWSATKYVGLTMGKDSTIFGVNFVDGRIKGYPQYDPRTKEPNTMYARMVRNNTEYGKNSFVDNGDGTITDTATGLMWQTTDDGTTRDWEEALAYCEDLSFAGHDDWRLPTVKELQSLVDYGRSPQTTNSPAIDPLFNCTQISDPDGNPNWGFYWSSTTHLDGMTPEAGACYVTFGEAQGEMNGNLLDVHGAGAQRSDPKSGNKADYPQFFGPQGDVRYVYNFVRAVRTTSGGTSVLQESTTPKSELHVSNSIGAVTLNLVGSDATTVALYSLNGREISSAQLTDATSNYLTLGNNLSAGVYLLKVVTASAILTQSVVVR